MDALILSEFVFCGPGFIFLMNFLACFESRSIFGVRSSLFALKHANVHCGVCSLVGRVLRCEALLLARG